MKVYDVQAGKEVDVPDNAVADGVRAGRIRLPAGAVDVVDQYGNLGRVDTAKAYEAINAGFDVAPPGAFDTADREARYSTAGQTAIAGLEGAAKGLTFNTSEAILGTALGDQYTEEARTRAEVNPVASIGGEVAGAVLPALLTGGTSAEVSGGSLLARGARGATALPRLAARGGLAAEAATARALGEGATAGGRILRAAASKAVGGAVEAAPYAAGRGLSTMVLDDDATMERVLAQVGLETMAGGLAGGVLGGGSRAAREGYDAVARKVFGDATHPGLGEAMARMSASLSGDDAGAIRRLALGDAGEGLLSAGARKNRATAFYGVDDVKDRVARELTGSFNDARRAVDTATDAFRGDVKATRIAGLLPEETASAQLAAHDAQLSAVKAQLDDMLADRSIPWRKELRQLRAAADVKIGDNAADAFAKVDRLKRELQSTVSAFGKAARKSDNPTIIARGRSIVDQLDASAESLRNHLTTEQLFGKAALAQREINDPWARMIAAGRNMENQAKLFRTVDNGRRMESVADEGAVSRYLGTLTDPKKDATHAAVRDWIEQGDAFVAAVRKHGGGSPELTGAVAAYQKAASTIKRGLAEAEDTIVLGNQAKALSTSGLLDGDGGNLLGAGAAFALDSMAPLGITAGLGAVKGAVNALATPGRSLRKLAAIERIVQQSAERIDAGLARYVANIGKDAGARAVRRVAAESTADKYTRTRDRLEDAAGNPDAAKAAVARSMQPAGNEAASAKMIERVGAANGFLMARMPQPPAPRSPWDRPEPSEAEMEKFARYVDAVEDPIGTLVAELDSGNLSSETMETIKALNPSIHQQIVATVTGRLAEQKEEPPFDDLVTLSLILDTPLTPAMLPERISQMQDSYQYSDQGTAPTKPATSAGMDKIADSHASAIERLTV